RRHDPGVLRVLRRLDRLGMGAAEPRAPGGGRPAALHGWRRAVSKKQELDRILGHGAESDGIEEYDNPMPNWWVGMFYLTIIWAVAYVACYHFIGRESYVKSLAAQVAEAEARWPKSSQLATVEETPAAIAAGEAVYKANCVACHGAELQGGIGPNLVDSTWIHG